MSIFGRRPNPEEIGTQLINGLESGALTLDEPTSDARVTLEPNGSPVPILVSFESHLYRVTNHGPGVVRVTFTVAHQDGEHRLPPGASIDLEATRIEVASDSDGSAVVGYELLHAPVQYLATAPSV